MHKACRDGDVAAVMGLITSEVDVEELDIGGWTPLHVACVDGDIEMVKMLIKSGIDANAKRSLPSMISAGAAIVSPNTTSSPKRVPYTLPASAASTRKR